MWDKHYRTAERQYLAGKYRNVEVHALKALELARAAQNPVQIAKTLDVLSGVYIDLKDPRAEETLRQSVEASEVAFGPKSNECANELICYAGWLEENGASDRGVPMHIRAIEIWDSLHDHDQFLEATDSLVEHLIDSEKYADAEKWFLRGLAAREAIYGPTSDEVRNEVETYVEILEHLGRIDECADLMPYMHDDCCDEDHDEEDEIEHLGKTEMPEAWQAILTEVTTALATKDEVDAEAGFRDAIAKASKLHKEETKTIPLDAPFRELRVLARGGVLRWLRGSLADVLRLKGTDHDDKKALMEAAEIFRALFEETTDYNDQMRLMLTLVDLAVMDEKYYSEIDEILAEYEDEPTVATIYTRALVSFRRNGNTTQSRRALREAIEFNPYVPAILCEGEADASEIEEYDEEVRDDADEYCHDAGEQWGSTPGIEDFIMDTMARMVPAGV